MWRYIASRNAAVLMLLFLGLLQSFLTYYDSSSPPRSEEEESMRGQRLKLLRSLQEGVQPKQIQEYQILSSAEIEDRLYRWSKHYVDLVKLTTAEAEYGLPRAGGQEDCPFAKGDGCPNSILTIQDFVAHPEGSDSSNRLPEVFWSGALHGNEQVGPTAVMQAAELLLDATACLALPRLSIKKDNPQDWDAELKRARDCRQDFIDFGFSVKDMWWLARLVSTRRIVVVPTANALGYFRGVREEDDIDPNRDFPYDYQKSKKHPEYNTECMQTIAARTLNEIFREHMFQLSLTFHAGMRVIGYEWGAPSHSSTNISPDDIAQNQVAAAYSHYAGGWPETPPYEYGSMNSLVYPVRGGMEDWAYAGSWDADRVIPCQPTTYTEYPIERTQYDNSTLRVVNMLVETSDDKIPTAELGSSWDVIKGFAVAGNGHVSRNIRVALLAAELVQPWLAIRNVNELELTDDIIPLLDRTKNGSCQEFKLVSVPRHSRKVVIEWAVGGSLNIEETKLWYARWSDVPDLNCMDQPPLNIEERMMEGTPLSDTSGKTRYTTTSSSTGTAHFVASMDLSDFAGHEKVVVMVSARVDAKWATEPNQAEPPHLLPQSHLANVRTNPDWFHTLGDKIIQGRLDWFSSPLTIEMGESDHSVATIELSQRLPLTDFNNNNNHYNTGRSKPGSSGLGMIIIWLISLLIAVAAVALVWKYVWRRRIRRGHRTRVLEFIEDEDAPNPGELHEADTTTLENDGSSSDVPPPYSDDDPNEDKENHLREEEEEEDDEPNGVEMGRFS